MLLKLKIIPITQFVKRNSNLLLIVETKIIIITFGPIAKTFMQQVEY